MEINEFTTAFREAFGAAAPLPIVFSYSHTPIAPVGRIPRCMVGAIRAVCGGGPLTLSADNVLCGGGRLYTAFAPMADRVPTFVSEEERYKQTPEMVREHIGRMGISLSQKPYLNFVRIDRAVSLDGAEGVVFFATPDVLSGLCSWAFYDNNAADAVSVPFASGCCGIVTMAARENEAGGRRCFIGMLDPSARPLVPEHELTFAVPACRFREMLQTMRQSALFRKAFSVVRKRINSLSPAGETV